MSAADLAAEVCELARGAGLDAVGIAPAEPFESTRAALGARAAAGLAADMQFTYRRPERSTDPSATLPGARSLVVGARSYPAGPPAVPAAAGAPIVPARVAAYARDDHYGALRLALGVVAEHLRSNGHRAVVVADDNALVDREAAHRAGLGWYGKSSNLLLPGRGSWFVLGSVITDADLPAPAAPPADGCGPCRRCIDGCPTGAIVAPGVVDARRCLAWTVQAPGVVPRELRAPLGDRIYGCDTCQEVCPPNHRVGTEPEPEGPPGLLDAVALLAMSDADLLDQVGRWYIADRDPRYVRRNALVVLGNGMVDADGMVPATLERYIADTDPLLRAHAVWAAAELGLTDLVDAARGDADPLVRAELAALAATGAAS